MAAKWIREKNIIHCMAPKTFVKKKKKKKKESVILVSQIS